MTPAAYGICFWQANAVMWPLSSGRNNCSASRSSTTRWQTESGWPMVANMAGIDLMPVKPGSATVPVCGYDVRVLDPDGRELPAGKGGAIAIRRPLPPGCLLNLWNNPERFQQAYMTTYPGYYFSDDAGYRDADGYVYITGRLDDIIKVAGHRLSTAEMEEAVASHPDVAECAVVGIADELKGEVPLGLVVLKSNADIDATTLEEDIRARVREYVGRIASFKRIIVVPQLPKTRSGKILRGIIRGIIAGEDVAVPSTIEDPAALRTLVATLQK